MSFEANQFGSELLINLDQVIYVKKLDHNQLVFHFSGDQAVALFTSEALRNTAFDDLKNTGPPGADGRGIGKQ